MFTRYVTRGLKAGLVAGIAFGVFVALVGDPLVGYAETFEHGHGGGEPVVSGTITTVVSIVGGILLGILFGAVVLGAAFYFLEPAIPGVAGTKSYVLGTAGFITVSGAPWLLLPPQPPGVEQALATEVRIVWYLIMMVTGALACGLSGYAYTRLRTQYGRPPAFIGAFVMLGLIPVVAAIGPANPVSGPIPVELAYVFRTVTGVGQVGLWFVLASAHAWLCRRDGTRGADRGAFGLADAPARTSAD